MVSLVDLNVDMWLGITCEWLFHLQHEDPFCKRIMNLLKSSKLQSNNLYYMEDELLMRNIIDKKQCFHTMVLAQVLMIQILRAAYDDLGHNSSTRTNMLVHRLYYWNGLKANANKHIKQCMMCQKRNIQAVKYAQLHISVPRLPVQYISTDLIGLFDPSSNGYHYTLMMICLLTGDTFCIPLKTKTASEVVQAYIDEVYAKFGGSIKILSDNGTGCKNQLFTDVAI